MSEFKYACPVCGQHIKCDSSQAGTVMDCPTCFQKITVPQAPASADQKFILTGSKVEEKKRATPAAGPVTAPPVKEFPAAMALGLILACMAAGACVYFFALPHSRWKSADIGTVGTAGTFSQQEQTFTIAGSGADIWSQADALHFVSRAMSGDIRLTAHVVGIQNTDPWAKAGLMMRESLTPDSANVMVCVTANNGVTFQARTNAGAQTVTVRNITRLHAPYWVRLTREGNTFTAELSANGKAWKPAGSTTVTMKKGVRAGLAVSSHKNAALCKASFDNVAFAAALGAKNPPPAKASSPASAPVNASASTPAKVPASASESTPAGTPAGSPESTPVNTNAAPVPASPASPSVLTAAPAGDTNWMLVLDTNAIPDSPVAGRIHGQEFVIEHAAFSTNGLLTLRTGSRGAVEFGVLISFSGAQAEELSGKTLNVTTNVEHAAKLTLRWKDDSGKVQKQNFDAGYALRLQFGTLANNRLPGKIHLCLPDPEKSYLLGSFTASARPRPAPK